MTHIGISSLPGFRLWGRMIYLLAQGTPMEFPDFAFDAEINEDMSLEYEWTEYPIEDGAKVSDHGFKLPEKFNVSGAVTETPLLIVSPYLDESENKNGGKQRVMDALTALKKVADARQPLTLVAKYWSPADVVIDSIMPSMGEGDGNAVRIEIAVHQVQLPKAKTVDIPASRYKKKKKRKAPAAPGGAASKKDPANKTKKKWKSRGAALADGGLSGLLL